MLIFLCGALTLTINFREVLGGLARGYLNTPEDSKITVKLSNGISTFDSRLDDYFILHDYAIDAYGAIQKAMGVTLINDAEPNYNVVKLNNDYLCFKATGDSDSTFLKEYVSDINSICKKNGIDFLYVKKPGKSTYDLELLPKYFPYRYESNFQSVKQDMIKSGIDVLDLMM